MATPLLRTDRRPGGRVVARAWPLLLGLLVAGCTGAGGAHPPAFEITAKGTGPAFDTGDFPLDPGPHLTYQVQAAGQAGTVDADTWYLGKLTRDDGVVVQLQALAEPGQPVIVTQLRQTADALQDWGTGTRTMEDPPLSILAFPLRSGGKWVSRDLGGATLLEGAVLGVVSVTVPAGTYQAWEVKRRLHFADGSTSDSLHWYAKGVGQVKRTGGAITSSVLEKVTP